VVKIGLLCASEQIRVIADLVQDKTIVLDPTSMGGIGPIFTIDYYRRHTFKFIFRRI
jgi:hypothetical protein